MRLTTTVFLVVWLAALAMPGTLRAEDEIQLAGTPSWGEALLNLDFEAADEAAGWTLAGEGYTFAVDRQEKQGGERSLRITCRKPGQSGTATQTFPVEEARGKFLRLIGYLRTENVTGGQAGLWLRVDGPDGVLRSDNMFFRGATETQPWRRYDALVDVPEEAVGVVFGAALSGEGMAWVDTLSFELWDADAPMPEVTVTGIVNDPDGRPVAGAHVAAVTSASSRIAGRARTGDDGRFAIALPAGEYGLTASAPGFAGTFHEPSWIGRQETVEHWVVTLGRQGFTLSGRITTPRGDPLAGVGVQLSGITMRPEQEFYTETDEKGHYALTVSSAVEVESYLLRVDSEQYIADRRRVRRDTDQTVDLEAYPRVAAPEEAVAWIRKHAVPLATVQPEQGFKDLAPLRERIGEARVVGLGEATHGTREFFQLKHRLFEFLVEEMGFTVFAIEANWPESLAINDYVLHGKGNAKDALAGIYFWIWNTEEVLALIEWMRRYNADPRHEKKLKFYGVDMQTAIVAVREAVTFLKQVDGALAQEIDTLVEPLKHMRAFLEFETLPEEQQRAVAAGVERAIRRVDEERDELIASSGERPWVLGRQQLVVVQQAIRYFSDRESFQLRDQAMAANVQWILDTEPPGTRVALWAHSGHLTRRPPFGTTMGWYLARDLGPDYVVFGFTFDRGSFQARDWTLGWGRPGERDEHTVGPAPAPNVGAALARAGMPICVLDLRQLPAQGPVADWFRRLQPMRQWGGVFSDEESASEPVLLPAEYDFLIFVETTTRARPVTRQ